MHQHKQCVGKFYKEVDKLSNDVPAVMQTVKQVPDPYRRS